VAGLGARLAFAFGRGRLGVDGPLSRRGGRVETGRAAESGLEFANASVLLGDSLCGSQPGELDQVAVDGRQLLGLLLCERAVKSRSNEPCDPRISRKGSCGRADSCIHDTCIPCARPWRKSEFSEFFTFLPPDVLQTGEVLRVNKAVGMKMTCFAVV
jgi:hypothetical protein